MSNFVFLRIRWLLCCSSSMIFRVRYVGEKVGRVRLERGIIKGWRGEREDKLSIEGKKG